MSDNQIHANNLIEKKAFSIKLCNLRNSFPTILDEYNTRNPDSKIESIDFEQIQSISDNFIKKYTNSDETVISVVILNYN